MHSPIGLHEWNLTIIHGEDATYDILYLFINLFSSK